MRLRPLLLSLSILPLAVFGVAAAPADGDPTVSIDVLETQVGSETLDVTGGISWSGAATVATDPEGDALVPGIGTDYTAATITKEMDATTLTFSMAIADSIPEVNAVGEVIQYNWPLTVEDNEVSLQAWRSARNQSDPRSTDPVFNVNVCGTNPDTGQGECTATVVDGEFADGHISWFVPASVVDADPGEKIMGAGAIYSSPGASGFIWLNQNSPVLFDSMMQLDILHVPGAVDLALNDVDGNAVVTGSAIANPDGSFADALDTSGVASGDYTLVATTCYGGIGGCVSQSTPVTIP